MDPFEAIKKERKAAKVLCGTTKDAKSVAALATAFGLKGDASLYHQVDTEMARQILVNVLHRVTDPGIRFLTNAKFKQGAAAALVISHWDPATTSTFDTGVLMLGTADSGCVWIAEED